MFANLLNTMISGFNRIAFPVAKAMSFVLSGDQLVDKDDLLNEGNIKNFGQLAAGVQRIMRDLVGPIMIVIGAILAIFMIKVGIDYAKAEDSGKRKEKMGQLIGLGVGICIVLIGVTLCYAINWVELYANVTGHKHTFVDTNPNDNFCDDCGQQASSAAHK